LIALMFFSTISK